MEAKFTVKVNGVTKKMTYAELMSGHITNFNTPGITRREIMKVAADALKYTMALTEALENLAEGTEPAETIKDLTKDPWGEPMNINAVIAELDNRVGLIEEYTCDLELFR